MPITKDILNFDGSVLCSITHEAKDKDGNILTEDEIEVFKSKTIFENDLELHIEFEKDVMN